MITAKQNPWKTLRYTAASVLRCRSGERCRSYASEGRIYLQRSARLSQNYLSEFRSSTPFTGYQQAVRKLVLISTLTCKIFSISAATKIKLSIIIAFEPLPPRATASE